MATRSRAAGERRGGGESARAGTRPGRQLGLGELPLPGAAAEQIWGCLCVEVASLRPRPSLAPSRAPSERASPGRLVLAKARPEMRAVGRRLSEAGGVS